jgi:hypothetical protein
MPCGWLRALIGGVGPAVGRPKKASSSLLLANAARSTGEHQDDDDDDGGVWDPDSRPKQPPPPPPKIGSLAGAAAYEEKRDARTRVTFSNHRMSEAASRMLQGTLAAPLGVCGHAFPGVHSHRVTLSGPTEVVCMIYLCVSIG